MPKPALGRGLGALLGGSPIAKPPAASSVPAPISAVIAPMAPGERIHQIEVHRIHPCRFQPRKDFPPESLRELADSIRSQGIVQPLIVREHNGEFELIAGERRWRAAQLAGLAEVPVLVRSAGDEAVLELALIENLQRENLNPIEEAQGYAQLIEHFQLTQEEVSAKVGKSRTVIANALRLLKLSTTIQGYLREGRLSVGHAKAILGLAGEAQQDLAAARVLKEALNVRQTEGLIARWHSRSGTPERGKPTLPGSQDAQRADLENRLRERLGTKVHLRYQQGKGAVEISFFSDAELERVLQLLGVSVD